MNYLDADTPICTFLLDRHHYNVLVRAQQRGYGQSNEDIYDLVEDILSQPRDITRSRNAGGPHRWLYHGQQLVLNNHNIAGDPRVVISHAVTPPCFVTMI